MALINCGNASMCDWWYNYTYGNLTSVPAFEADADIAGIGVSIAFMTSNLLTLLLALLWLCLTATRRKGQNQVDDFILIVLQRPFGPSKRDMHNDFWIPIVQKVILCLSDQLLLTGMAISVAAFALHCTISVYHVTIVSDLVWFSSNVHLTTLRVLDSYFRERTTQRNWRVLLMVIMAFFLITITVWQGHWACYNSEQFNAQCLFQDLPNDSVFTTSQSFLIAGTAHSSFWLAGAIGGKPGFEMIILLVVLVFSYSITLIALFPSFEGPITTWTYSKPLGALDKSLKFLRKRAWPEKGKAKFRSGIPVEQVLSATLYGINYVIRFFFIVAGHAFTSYSIILIGDFAWFAYGVYCLLADRDIPNESPMTGDESAMGFGQIIPILLLSSIILTSKEAYDDQVYGRRTVKLETSSSRISIIHSQSSQSQRESVISTPYEMSGALQSQRDSVIFTPYEMSEVLHSPDEAEEVATFAPRRVDTNTIEMGINPVVSATEAPRSVPQRRTTSLLPGNHDG